MIAMVGMQWYDGDPKKDILLKLKAAMAHYAAKQKAQAKICLVSQKNADGVDFAALSLSCGVPVKPPTILPKDHFWVGEERETVE
jgi:hypothetical protein